MKYLLITLLLLASCATTYEKRSVNVPMYIHFADADEVHYACQGREACSRCINGIYNVLINRETPCIDKVFWGEMEHILGNDNCLYGGM